MNYAIEEVLPEEVAHSGFQYGVVLDRYKWM